MAAPRDEFAAHCVELLAPLGAVRAKRLFGGHGIYVDELMIALIADETLYFKTDAQTLPRWQAAGGRAFVYESRRAGQERKVTAMSYWTPPDEALDSPSLLAPWGRLALEAALRAHAARAARPRKSAAAAATKPRRR
ncbi:TfoX/Sxy family protein [uncultured Methylibium sp.]|uniref:TfoX/Sxy family protein n=1 Tax=uncultured Methylibium sp. TaxID=381093 RepID=UPI0025CF69A2|nr:TfoX/Sxy family protein [uncultured Methylibium sp.]